MGLLNQLVEETVQSVTGGLSDVLGITGEDGLLHDSDDDCSANEVNLRGLSLHFGTFDIKWKDIALVIPDDEFAWGFMCKGGLFIMIDAVSDKLDGMDVDNLARFPMERLNAPQEISPHSRKEDTVRATRDLLWALDTADRIRGEENVTIDEEALFEGCVRTLAYLDVEGVTDDDNDIKMIAGRIRKKLRMQFSRIDIKSDQIKKSMELALLVLSGDNFRGCVREQKGKYEELCASLKYSIGDECLLGRKDVIAPLLPKDGAGAALGDAAWYHERKTIICTDKPLSLAAFAKRKRLEGVMVMDAADIILYNESVTDSTQRLVFQIEPQNGCTYVQHPFRRNHYYEVNSFHASVRERKQNELLRILESLGAYSAYVEVRHERQETANHADESHVSAKGSHGAISGEMSCSTNAERQSTLSASQSAIKDWTFNPPEKPSLPDDLVFYPTEETWQQLAQSVLRGGLKRAQVDLEYKTEYGITEKYLTDISASVKALIPSFEMNLKQGFSSDLHRLTTTQWHYVVEFENEAGERAGANNAPTLPSVAAPPSANSDKAEALFAKRAKRYAQSEGHINSEQRADLEAFAKKYGIDEFRMEELIEEAFV